MSQQELEQLVLILKGRLDAFELNDRFMISKTLQIADGRSVQVGRGTGTMIGTAADQKLGFFGHVPVAQQSHISAPSGGTTVDSQARAAVTSTLSALEALGFIA